MTKRNTAIVKPVNVRHTRPAYLSKKAKIHDKQSAPVTFPGLAIEETGDEVFPKYYPALFKEVKMPTGYVRWEWRRGIVPSLSIDTRAWFVGEVPSWNQRIWAYLPTYLHTYIHTYIRIYIHTYALRAQYWNWEKLADARLVRWQLRMVERNLLNYPPFKLKRGLLVILLLFSLSGSIFIASLYLFRTVGLIANRLPAGSNGWIC